MHRIPFCGVLCRHVRCLSFHLNRAAVGPRRQAQLGRNWVAERGFGRAIPPTARHKHQCASRRGAWDTEKVGSRTGTEVPGSPNLRCAECLHVCLLCRPHLRFGARLQRSKACPRSSPRTRRGPILSTCTTTLAWLKHWYKIARGCGMMQRVREHISQVGVSKTKGGGSAPPKGKAPIITVTRHSLHVPRSGTDSRHGDQGHAAYAPKRGWLSHHH